MFFRLTFVAGILLLVGAETYGADDWDLYMLKLVNRARHDPAGEAARIGSGVTDNTVPQPPLAYRQVIENAATNHNNWMHDNFGTISSGGQPDSLVHYETTNGAANGTPDTAGPNFTGVDPGVRVTFVGFTWNAVAENINAAWANFALPVNEARIDANHKSWWESAGHRSNMLSSLFTVFGHHTETRSFTPPRGNINPPFNTLNLATQVYSKPQSAPQTFALGVLYSDVDGNGAWTPRATGDPQRESQAGKNFVVYTAGTHTLVTSGSTLDNGVFSIPLNNGSYDIEFTGVATPSGKLRIENVIIAGQNVDVGDRNILAITKGDFNGNGHVDADDFAIFKACATRDKVPYNTNSLPAGCPAPVNSSFVAPDLDHDQDVDMNDFAVFQRCYSGAAIATNASCP